MVGGVFKPPGVGSDGVRGLVDVSTVTPVAGRPSEVMALIFEGLRSPLDPRCRTCREALARSYSAVYDVEVNDEMVWTKDDVTLWIVNECLFPASCLKISTASSWNKPCALQLNAGLS
jgi:hypothetical protein